MNNPKIIGYSRQNDDWRKPPSYHLKDIASTIHTLTRGGWNTDQFILEPMNNEKTPTNNLPQTSKRRAGLKFFYNRNGLLTARRTDRGFIPASEWIINTPDGTAGTIQANTNVPKVMTPPTPDVPRLPSGAAIRKLTPRECFQLMGVAGTDIDKIQAAGISESQQYKLAGNSIVVDVLANIFRTLFIDTEPPTNTQLKLF